MTTQNVLTVLGAIGIFGYLFHIHKTQKRIMATLAQFEDALNRIDEATTATAEELRSLREELTNAGLDAETEASVLARLNTAADRLEAVGASVEEPVPAEEEPTEEPTPGEPTPGEGEETTED